MRNYSFINLDEIRSFYKEKCKYMNKSFTENNFRLFVAFCETDFFDWLESNMNYFAFEENDNIDSKN
jgi:hypothetical protein